MLYEVRALSSDNRLTTLVVEAQDEAGARRSVAERSLRALTVRRARGAPLARSGGRFSLALFSEELLALLEAGLSIVEALESLAEKSTPGAARDLSARLAQQLRQGMRFSQALAAAPEFFPPLYVGIVQAAETTSDLPGALARYVDFEQRIAAVRSRAISAAIYPSILLVVGTSVTLFLLGYVVPRFATVYEESGRSMSAVTSLLMTWGRFVSSHAEWLLLGLALLAVAGAAAWRFARRRYTVTDLLVRVPWLARQVRAFEMSRLYMTAGILLAGGIPLVRVLQMVQASSSAEMRARLERTIPRIAAGESFSGAMSAEGLADAVALRLFRVGEQAGNLGEMLIKAARFYDTEVSRFIERFTRAAEPILMTAIGIIVGTIVVLLYMPIFELAGSLQ